MNVIISNIELPIEDILTWYHIKECSLEFRLTSVTLSFHFVPLRHIYVSHIKVTIFEMDLCM
jgi:hypothetical protein